MDWYRKQVIQQLHSKCSELNDILNRKCLIRNETKPSKIGDVNITYKYFRYYIYHNYRNVDNIHTHKLLLDCKPNEIIIAQSRFSDDRGYCDGYYKFVDGKIKFHHTHFQKLYLSEPNLINIINGIQSKYITIYSPMTDIESDKILAGVESYTALSDSINISYHSYVTELYKQKCECTSLSDELKQKLYMQEQFFALLQGRHKRCGIDSPVNVLCNDVLDIIFKKLIS